MDPLLYENRVSAARIFPVDKNFNNEGHVKLKHMNSQKLTYWTLYSSMQGLCWVLNKKETVTWFQKLYD